MTSEDRPWEPPLAADEQGALLGALDRLRWTFRFKVDGLDGTGLRTTIGASSLTLGALLKHLAAVEAYYSTARLTGAEWGEPWSAVDWDANPGWECTSAAADAPAELYALYDDAVARSRERFYGRHTGHADLLREAVDGRVGEDPPGGWRPTAVEGTAVG